MKASFIKVKFNGDDIPVSEKHSADSSNKEKEEFIELFGNADEF